MFAGPARRGGACVVDEMPPWLTRPPLGTARTGSGSTAPEAAPLAPEANRTRREQPRWRQKWPR